MQKHLFNHVDFRPEATHLPRGASDDIALACQDYEEAIKTAGGIELQLLGIGTDGHIGFNEPSSSLTSRTRVKTLTPRTREDNREHFDGEVPHHVITMGTQTILDARRVVLLQCRD